MNQNPSPERRAPPDETSLLWDFCVRFYQRPGVGEACVALQDRVGLDVNVLLFAIYLGMQDGIALEPTDVTNARGKIAAWNADIVTAIRAVRRALKPLADTPSPHSDAISRMRTMVKSAELSAERIELDMLWDTRRDVTAMRKPGNAATALANVRAVLAAFGATEQTVPPAIVAALEQPAP